MHQQIRVKLGTRGGSVTGGHMSSDPVEQDPIEVRRGALVRLLDLLSNEGKFNLQVAGGTKIEFGGEFVFSVHEKEHDHPGHNGHAHDESQRCREFLTQHRYKFDVLEPHYCEVDDESGTLADCLRPLIQQGRDIDEVFVGTPEHGKIPIQVTTVERVPSEGTPSA
jgi:hypothetical protein